MQDFLSQSSGELPMEDFQWFVREVHRHFGLDLSGYKPHRMKRRIEILIRKYRLSSYQEYLRLLLTNSSVKEEFLDKITINVTEFFRNPEKSGINTFQSSSLFQDRDSRRGALVVRVGKNLTHSPYSLKS